MKKLTKQGLPKKYGGSKSPRNPFRERKKKANPRQPTRLGAVLQDALQHSCLKIDMDLFKIWSQWPHLVGPVVSQQTRPEAIKESCLLVNVSSGPWLQELQFLKDEIMSKLNTCLDREAVTDIRFQIGPVSKEK